MSRLKRMIQGFPTHHLLIIIFFVLEGNNEFFPDVPLASSGKLFGFFLLIATISYFICNALFKDIQRAAVASLLFTYILLYARTMYHYYALPWGNGTRISNTHFFLVLGLVTVLCIIAIRKSSLPALQKFNRFLTILFMTLVLYTSVAMIYKSFRPEKHLYVTLNEPQLNQPIPRAKPNIYLLVFDEYQGNDGLDYFFGNSFAGPDSILQKKGFHIIKHPASNYNYTFYSIPSLLNMSYLNFSDGKLDYDLLRVVKSVRTMGVESPMFKYLKQQQYHIVNYSFFDVAGIAPQRSLAVPHDGYSAIFSRTLPGWLQEDLLHFIPSNNIQSIVPTYFYQLHQYNEAVITGLAETIQHKTLHPSFIYAHLLLPHPPMITDEKGNLKNISAAMYEVNRQLPSLKSSYAESLSYANMVLEKMITDIQTSDPASVIVFASDHGLRVYPDQQSFVFNNQCAVYIPGNQYEGFYDNVSLVNVMRLVLNNALGLTIPLTPDSTRLAK